MPDQHSMSRRSAACLVGLLLLPLIGACGPSLQRAVAVPSFPTPVPPPVVESPAIIVAAPTALDPVLELIAESDRLFLAGKAELDAGHVDGARSQFDSAVRVLIESEYGGRTEPRIREHFDRLVDRISTSEARALSQGDGYTEKQYDPASIDELLSVSATLTPPPATRELKDTISADLQAGESDVPIPLNQRVLAFVSLFQGRLHDFLLEGLKRGSQYLPMIQDVFRAEGLPLDLAYVPLVESAFKPSALSRAKAKGVWQFMRGTGLENGLRSDWFIDERSDPEKATVAAAKYLGTLGRMFDGDWHLALASYNGGPGRLQRAMKAGKASDFWVLAAKPRLLPRETRDYVPMILAAIIIARNPALYGFEFEPEPVRQYETVELPRPVDLRRVAEWAETSIDQIQTLNPELRRWTTPIREEAYPLRVPAGSAALVKARFVETPPSELASLNWYVVKRGDTLAVVARKLKVSRADLAEANYLKTSARLAAGQKLMVPREASILMAARPDLPALAGHAPLLAAGDRAQSQDRVAAAVDTSAPARARVSYRVKRGDTLASIARLFGTSIASIQTWNGLRGSLIRSGDRLTIYTARAD